MILLSIVIPVYNRPKKLQKAIDSLLKSDSYFTHQKKIEVIIIDDASTSPLKKPKPGNITLLRNTSNIGAPKSRQRGYQNSKGLFVHFHDSDDQFSANWLDEVLNVLDNNRRADILLTGRKDISVDGEKYRYQKYFHNNVNNIENIKKRLIYRNCMGPLGGVTFSRSILSHVNFKNLASSQDWHMYLEAIEHSKILISKPQIQYYFFIDGTDRISVNPSKKILGYLQLSKKTKEHSIFEKKIKYFYLHTCREHIKKKGGAIENYYKNNLLKILFYFLIISIYWRLT